VRIRLALIRWSFTPDLLNNKSGLLNKHARESDLSIKSGLLDEHARGEQPSAYQCEDPLLSGEEKP